MFGYVTINRLELKGKHYDRYRAFYCGLCNVLHNKYGIKGQMTLTYDMTFLIIFLTSLYEKKSDIKRERCIIHPCARHAVMINEYTSYAADMSIVLAYYNFIDNWQDDRDIKSRAAMAVLKKDVQKIKKKYKRQCKVIESELKALAECEKRGEREIDTVSYHFGKILEEIFVYKRDIWEDTVRKIGFYLGKFIYLMDSWDDLEKDRDKGSYNIFEEMSEQDDFDDECRQILIMMMAECSRKFELLPILKNRELLRNILYSGVWLKWDIKHREKRGKDGSI